jgi:uncharacterized membrane protein/membrane-bound inhibitor of C-type lysozyme
MLPTPNDRGHRRARGRRAPAFLLLAAVAACSIEETPHDPPPPVGQDTGAHTGAHTGAMPGDTALFSFTCGDVFRFTVRYEGHSATLFLPDTVLRLERTPAATGARFTRARVEFWHRGSEASLELPDTLHSSCALTGGADPWTAARLRGAALRAVGQEPGWTLEIEPAGMIIFVTDYGERTIQAPVPIPVRDNGRTAYHAVTEAHDLHVFILDAPCTDVMSGEHFPVTVTVVLDGHEHRGCGRRYG